MSNGENAGFLVGSRCHMNTARQPTDDTVYNHVCFPGDACSFRRNSLTLEELDVTRQHQWNVSV